MTPPLPEQRCFNCRYVTAKRGTMRCYRYPPATLSTVQNGTASVESGWPEVFSNTFCGEWAARATVPVPEPEPVRAHRPAADYLRLRLLLARALWGAEATEGLFDLQTPEGIAAVVEKRIRTLEQTAAALRAVRDVP